MFKKEKALTFWREEINVGAWGWLRGAGAEREPGRVALHIEVGRGIPLVILFLCLSN